MKTYYIYIMTNRQDGVIFIGVTNNLARRVYEHKNHLVEGFTSHYNLQNLVYYESTNSVETAIEREKQLKAWRRDWKVALIQKENPWWRDLSSETLQ